MHRNDRIAEQRLGPRKVASVLRVTVQVYEVSSVRHYDCEKEYVKASKLNTGKVSFPERESHI